MKTKIAINGFGRIGRGAFRVAFSRDDIEVVAINDLADARTLAHLLKYDSIYGQYNHEVSYDENNIVVDSQSIKAFKQTDPSLLPWGDLDIDVVIEATGQFTDAAKARTHINPAGAKKVIISAVVNDESVDTIVIGVNEDRMKQAGDIISAASCTTNCSAPVLDVLSQNFGIDKVMMTTVHSYTGSQRLIDASAKDLRESRAAAQNIIPTSTNASVGVTKALPELAGKFAGMSVRVPTSIVSIVDFAVVTQKPTTAEEVNESFKKAAAEPYYQGILTISEDELVSSDFIGNSHSAIVDTKLTKVVGGNLVKVVAWYDNEWGYCNRLVELAADVGKLLGGSDHQPVDSNLAEVNITEE